MRQQDDGQRGRHFIPDPVIIAGHNQKTVAAGIHTMVIGVAAKAFRGGSGASQERTDRDVSVMVILLGTILSAVGIAAFYGTLGASWAVVAVALVLTLVFSFFFASVAANAIATTARNPVSGMTMLTIIVSSVILLRFGISGTTGMFFV